MVERDARLVLARMFSGQRIISIPRRLMGMGWMLNSQVFVCVPVMERLSRGRLRINVHHYPA